MHKKMDKKLLILYIDRKARRGDCTRRAHYITPIRICQVLYAKKRDVAMATSLKKGRKGKIKF